MAVRKHKAPSKLDLILAEIREIKVRLDKHDQLFKDLIKANNLIDPTI